VSQRKAGAPGIYLANEQSIPAELQGAKIAALGLKVTKQCCYHGLALNVDMDLAPFSSINPCGYEGLKTVDMKSLGVSDNIDFVAKNITSHLSQQLEVRS
jgi:lipoyl(octanoyl) transferase